MDLTLDLGLVNYKADSLQAFHGKKELLTSKHTDRIEADIISRKCSVVSVREYMVHTRGIDRASNCCRFLHGLQGLCTDAEAFKVYSPQSI